jgi:dTDP-4-amino-4,6-dideoxygalactose transaminase
MNRINVTQTFLPPFEEYEKILKRAWDKKWITNNGELVLELEEKLKAYLGVEHLLFTNNGTVVLQMALQALEIKGDVITTPFSYVATTNAILWEGSNPVFVDIDPVSFCIDPSKIEASITENTKAILATHVFGVPCDIEAISKIAEKHNLKVIYDGAHAFGCTYNDKSLLSYGDISTCSFHATKVFHTVEGGCIIASSKELYDKLKLYRSFGHYGDDYYSVGINGKNSEFHAAMGLAVLPHMDEILSKRMELWNQYQNLLAPLNLMFLSNHFLKNFNYGYFPCIFNSKVELETALRLLNDHNIFPRKYFYPSLNTLPFLKFKSTCPISENISQRILCLPLYPDLKSSEVEVICSIIKEAAQ